MYSPKPVQTRIQFILFAFLQRKTAIKIFLKNKNNPDLPANMRWFFNIYIVTTKGNINLPKLIVLHVKRVTLTLFLNLRILIDYK